MSKSVLLEDRGVVEVAGPDAAKFLHNLLTNDIASLRPGEARFAALLTPQGKILFDFLVFALEEQGERRFLLDCPRALAADLTRRLGLYKLRSKIAIADRSGEVEALAFLADQKPASSALASNALVMARDPRSPLLGWRALAAKGAVAAEGDRADYERRRIAAAVPQGGVDFAYGDAFPHEANMDLLAGVDFRKGCYVGQEVVSRVKHRGLARKRVARFQAKGVAPAPGTPIVAGEIEIGVAGSSSGDQGLASIRLDRLAEAEARGDRPHAGGVEVTFAEPPQGS